MKKTLLAFALAALLLVQAALAEDASPASTPVPSLSPEQYTYATVTSSALGLQILYPSHWENLPGRYTVCFREPVNEGEVAARFAITYKKLESKPSDDQLQSQLVGYLKAILIGPYDNYEYGTLLTDLSFLGKSAIGCVYKGFKGDQTVRGYVVMCAIGSTVYAYHFSCGEADYAAMETVMTHLLDGAKTA